jgi:hypothetical protein
VYQSVSPSIGSAALSKCELKCSIQVSKVAQKLASAIYREKSRCRIGRIKGSVTEPCPTAKSTDKIGAEVEALVAAAEKSCGSTCSTSPLVCLGSELCPPAGDGQNSARGEPTTGHSRCKTLASPGPTASSFSVVR